MIHEIPTPYLLKGIPRKSEGTGDGFEQAAGVGWESPLKYTAARFASSALYQRQDEVGTPFCVTVDVQTVGDAQEGEAEDGKVTVRERDSMQQIRVPIAELPDAMRRLFGGRWADVAARYPPQQAPA